MSLGYSYTKSDKLSQLTFNGWVLRRTSLRQTRFDASATLTNTEGTEATVRYDASLDHRRLLKGKLFAELAGGARRGGWASASTVSGRTTGRGRTTWKGS